MCDAFTSILQFLSVVFKNVSPAHRGRTCWILFFFLVPMFVCLHVRIPWKAAGLRMRSWNDVVEGGGGVRPGRGSTGRRLLRSAEDEEEASPLLVQE